MSAATSGETFELRAVELDFLESAPHRFEYAEPVGAPVDRVFAAIAADPSTWTWFPGIEEGAYETSTPGVGARRWVRIGGVKYRETMLAWDAPRRWAYRVDETSAPVFAALTEAGWSNRTATMPPRCTGRSRSTAARRRVGADRGP
jgi:hypothetical protein